ncbi:NUDIX domain-containing protein [Rhodococcus sp. USK10]|uniref:NUDIX domain-containing protein n=1 Tax=Rhodococcus sp. USK10 TaxID=2789739 RepID=UPI001C5D1691|nr:NUDIX domain-containing protein [Rhodococcus sp. USK10]QYB07430.1 NUDIX domain-containing protein [Rhodococcus sp. USK10]
MAFSGRRLGRSDRSVVALLLLNQGELCLLRRSSLVASDPGRWHCITGYLDSGDDPAEHVLVELGEETGLSRLDLADLVAGPVLSLPGGDGVWTVHVFVATARHQRVRLNWEHEDVCWTPWSRAGEDGRELVPWLPVLVAESLPHMHVTMS